MPALTSRHSCVHIAGGLNHRMHYPLCTNIHTKHTRTHPHSPQKWMTFLIECLRKHRTNCELYVPVRGRAVILTHNMFRNKTDSMLLSSRRRKVISWRRACWTYWTRSNNGCKCWKHRLCPCISNRSTCSGHSIVSSNVFSNNQSVLQTSPN
jgi:hypothetical protein